VRAREIPGLLDALADARAARVLVVGAAGNEGKGVTAFPARSRHVLAVGATTERGCLSDFSNTGARLDLVAPGGGVDSYRTAGEPGCDPAAPAGRPILQISFEREREPRRFGLPTIYEGTSMAVPQVSATAALVIATGVLGARPSPERLRAHLRATARDLGPAGVDGRYGAGLLDAGAATAPSPAARSRRRAVTSSG
jgi:serine protease